MPIIDVKKIDALRLAKVWSKTELCRRAQVTQATFFGIQAGRSKASFKTINKLAKALGVPAAEIVRDK